MVVSADDLGMSAGADEAIFAALSDEVCTAASLLATGPTAEAALRRCREAGLAVGVHLALTELAPATRSVDRLVGPDGRFRPDVTAITDDAGVAAEWTAQVARVRDAGVAVDHLDSHQHVHHLPVLARALREVCAATGIRRVRGMGALRVPGVGTRAGALVQPLRAARFRAGLRRDGLVTTDGFASVEAFLARAGGGRRLGWRTVELMAHPGNPHHARYAEELAALRSGALDRLPFPVTRVGWAAIAAT